MPVANYSYSIENKSYIGYAIILQFRTSYLRVSIINSTIVIRVHLLQFVKRLDSLKGLNHTTSHKYFRNKWKHIICLEKNNNIACCCDYSDKLVNGYAMSFVHPNLLESLIT